MAQRRLGSEKKYCREGVAQRRSSQGRVCWEKKLRQGVAQRRGNLEKSSEKTPERNSRVSEEAAQR